MGPPLICSRSREVHHGETGRGLSYLAGQLPPGEFTFRAGLSDERLVAGRFCKECLKRRFARDSTLVSETCATERCFGYQGHECIVLH
jgi:hypothetical protein